MKICPIAWQARLQQAARHWYIAALPVCMAFAMGLLSTPSLQPSAPPTAALISNATASVHADGTRLTLLYTEAGHGEARKLQLVPGAPLATTADINPRFDHGLLR